MARSHVGAGHARDEYRGRGPCPRRVPWERAVPATSTVGAGHARDYSRDRR